MSQRSWVDNECFSLLQLIFPVTFLSTYPTQTDRDWTVEGLADSFMMKGPRSSWGKATWTGKAGCVKPVSCRVETVPLLQTIHECIRMWEGEKNLVNEPLPSHVCVLQGYRGHLRRCLCVRSVRWGQRSQPTDASEANTAGSQDGCSQTLIRETHHTAFPVFTIPQTFLTVKLLMNLHYHLTYYWLQNMQ